MGSSFIYKFGVDQRFRETAILRFRRFPLKLPIHVSISAAHAQNQRRITVHALSHAVVWKYKKLIGR